MTPMPANSTAASVAPRSSSLVAKLFDMLVYPGAVFDEVVAAPPRFANWLVPTVLVALASLVLLRAANNEAPPVTATSQAGEGQAASVNSPVAHTEPASADYHRFSALATCGGAFVGTFWTAFLIWLIGRAFLRARFSYLKTVEVVALAGSIVVLGAIVTALLVTAFGNAAARPALSIFALRLPADDHVRLVLDTVNLFHLWTISVLAIGLSRLSGVSFKESAFWVFGYWLVTRVVLILLA